jgi:hypothetical protein
MVTCPGFLFSRRFKDEEVILRPSPCQEHRFLSLGEQIDRLGMSRSIY